MLRSLVLLLAGLFGAALLSQAPAFADRYAASLDDRISEIEDRLVQIERDAAANLPTDADAGGLQDRRDRLEAHRAKLSAATPPTRLLALMSGYDRETADAALFDFEPAAPASLAAIAYAVAGFILGRGLLWLLLSGLGLFRRRQP